MSSNYPSNWNNIRKKIYKRDNYTCKNCGAKGGPHGPAELHAHHGVPLSKGGSNKLSNLQTYCKECHNAIHGNVQAPTADTNPRRKSHSVIDPTVTIVLELNTATNTPCPEDISRSDIASFYALIIGIITIPITTLITGSISLAVMSSIVSMIIAYLFFLNQVELSSDEMAELNKIAKRYNDKKREINHMIEKERNVPDKDLKELKTVHSNIIRLTSEISDGYIDKKFRHSVSSTSDDIRRIENGNLEFTT